MWILLRFLAAVWTAGLTSAPVAVLAQADQDRTNALVFVGAGWRNTGPYRNHFNQTPNSDRLAQPGLLVGYASPQCSPSRISTLSRVQSRKPIAIPVEQHRSPNSLGAP